MTASLYVAVSEYQRPLVEVDALRDAHWAWLQHQYERGAVLISGRRDPPVGGVIVAAAPSEAALDVLLAEDPFVRAGLARYRSSGSSRRRRRCAARTRTRSSRD